MNQRKLSLPFLAVALAVAAGCGSPLPAGSPASSPAGAADDGTVTATARFGPGRSLQAVAPWRKADIHHVRVSLYRGAGTTAVFQIDVPQAELAEGIVRFTNLRKNTDYKAVQTAWADAAELTRIDNAAADAASCTTSFTTTEAPSIDAGTLKLKLRDKEVVATPTPPM